MSTTLLVEPDSRGHRYQAVAHVAEVAGRRGDVRLLTSVGGRETDSFAVNLAPTGIVVEERLDGYVPPTREVVAEVLRICREHEVDTVVLMDADQSLKRWWYAARPLRTLPHPPRVVFMLTRYPAKVALTDRTGWKLRISKGALALLAMATRTLHRVAGFSGRDDTSPGWLVKRTGDPALCTAHSRDRARLREELDLPADRLLVGIFGVIGERKNAPLTLAAIQASDQPADLLLAGGLHDEVRDWLATLAPEDRTRVIVRDAFLSNEDLDRHVAASDAVALIMTNNGPSGIQGKALAAGVPVVSAGSLVRASELAATRAGRAADFTAESIGAALAAVLTDPTTVPDPGSVPMATTETFANAILGEPHNR